MSKKIRISISTFVFATVLYIVFAYKSFFPHSILGFVIPFILINYKETEIGFIMVFISTIASLTALNIHSSSKMTAFLNISSILSFYIIKNTLEKNNLSIIENIKNQIETIHKEISKIDSEIKFYNEYISKKQKVIESKKRILSFLKEIENSISEEETMSRVTKAIKILYPQSLSMFVLSPYTSKPIEDVFKTKTSLFIPSINKDSRYPKTSWDDKEKSAIIIPLITFSKTIAVLKITSEIENYFSKEDFTTLEIILNTASTTIENISLYRTIDNLARKDPLTGVFTRRIFDEKIEEEILVSARTKQPFSLLILDIDHFKKINDTYGHQMGDEVLKEVSKSIASQIREFDFLARYGGEEFVIIMPNTPKTKAAEIADEIAKKIKTLRFNYNNKVFNITISGGIGEFPSEGQSKTQIIRICDERLYKAKSLGRDKIIYE